MTGGRKAGQRPSFWTPEDSRHADVDASGEEGMACEAAAVGRSEGACQTRYHEFKDGGAARRTNREILDQAVAARKATEQLQHISLTSAFFGDPLPGRSALDKRGEGSSLRSISLGGMQ